MLISAFARASGLSRDTVRFYVRRGLLTPLASDKGGSNPYQIFTSEHVQMARTIRMAQSLGFSLREIAVLNVEYQGKRMTPVRSSEILRWQLGRLEEKAAHVNAMIRYIRAKLAWHDGGSEGPEPNFTDYESTAQRAEVRPRQHETRRKVSASARQFVRDGGKASRLPRKQKRRLARADDASK
jgi:MerR family copper efflux transcriptional regulator